MQKLLHFLSLLVFALILQACTAETPVDTSQLVQDDAAALAKNKGNDDDDKIVSKVPVVTFQPAGDFGGGVLVPGTFFPPTGRAESKLTREEDELSYKIRTTGLPPGAYTNWWVIFNNPSGCTGGVCDEDDFANPAADPTVFWATGGVVKKDGKGKFKAEIEVGELPPGPDQVVLGQGLTNPLGAEVHLIIKYHGPASDDPNELYLQTHTLTGLCESGANAFDLGPPFGVQCFDPQVAVHKPN